MKMNSLAGLYIRLSVMDDFKKAQYESESVENQRIMLKDYAKQHNFNVVKEYVDDGYSGANFDRPAFKDMMQDLKNGIIDTIIVKDLSRFGRDHIQTGYFIETFFPLNKIRFISLMERLDSQTQEDYNDNVTFVMACNDYFSKQNSIRIRTSLDLKKRQGKFVGGQAPFGYIKDPKDRNHLIPDPVTAPIVKKIFDMAINGYNTTEIKNYLDNNNLVTPSLNKNHKGYIMNKWSLSSINDVLKNRVYIGDMIQSKSEKASYKSDKTIINPRSKWIIVENTHEALVDKDTFNNVQNLSKISSTTPKGRKRELLENLCYCFECGNRISFTSSKTHNYLFGVCVTNHHSKNRKVCNPRHVIYAKLENQIKEKLLERNIDLKDFDRLEIQRIIDRIFIDQERNVKIIFKNPEMESIEFQYKGR